MLCTYPELLGRYRIQVVRFTARNRLSSTRTARSAALAVGADLIPALRKSRNPAIKWRMWTPPGGQARIQNRVRGSLVRYCRMSGLLMQPSLAAGPYGVRKIGSKSGMRARRPSAISWFFRSRLADRLPLPVLASLLPTSPGSFFAFHRPVRRHCEPDSPPFSWPAPRPSAPSCWRGPPRPASSACVPPSWPATDP